MEPLSHELMRALADEAPMSQALMAEWQSKRPDAYREHKRRVIAAATVAVHTKVWGAKMVTYKGEQE